MLSYKLAFLSAKSPFLCYNSFMAKTSYQQVSTALLDSYNSALQSADRFIVPRVRVKTLFLSRKRKKGLSQKTLLPAISQVWNSFDTTTKQAWSSAGAVCGLSGYKLFVKDKSLRIINDISGNATPSTIYQALVGRLHVEAPATGLKLTQLHPQQYWVSRLVKNKKSMREPVLVVENFSLPLKIKISYKSNLSAYGGTAKARFYAVVISLYQGRKIENILEIPFNLIQDWVVAEATLSNVVGYANSYALFLEIENARGDIYIDNVIAEHSGTNWVRDTSCNDINESFTKAFYQIPKNWSVINISEGAFFESIYYN